MQLHEWLQHLRHALIPFGRQRDRESQAVRWRQAHDMQAARLLALAAPYASPPSSTTAATRMQVACAFRGQRPVGCLGLQVDPETNDALLLRFFVRRAYRSNGYGQRLLAEAESHASAQGAGRIKAAINIRHIDALSLAHHIGYRPCPPFMDGLGPHVLFFQKELATSPPPQVQ